MKKYKSVSHQERRKRKEGGEREKKEQINKETRVKKRRKELSYQQGYWILLFEIKTD